MGNMKFLVLVSAMVAAAYADADADALYANFGYRFGYGYGYKSAPCVNAANQPVACAAGYTGYPFAYGRHLIGKRDADAEPEADADALLYAGAYTPYTTYGAGLLASPHRNYYNHGAFPYRRFGYTATATAAYNGITGYSHLIGKRDADAEPEADADASLLYTGAYTPYTTYGAGVLASPSTSFYNGAFPYGGFGYRTAYPYNTYNGYTGYTGYTGYSHLSHLY